MKTQYRAWFIGGPEHGTVRIIDTLVTYMQVAVMGELSIKNATSFDMNTYKAEVTPEFSVKEYYLERQAGIDVLYVFRP